jgi:N-acetyl-beta-hexosaminidase
MSAAQKREHHRYWAKRLNQAKKERSSMRGLGAQQIHEFQEMFEEIATQKVGLQGRVVQIEQKVLKYCSSNKRRTKV